MHELQVQPRLRLPAQWRLATALTTARATEDGVEFETVSLANLIDSPLICGEHLRTFDLSVKDFPPVLIHLTSESPAAIQLDDNLQAAFRRMIAETAALFHDAPFETYHFLVTCSDQAPGTAIEHHSSTLIGVRERHLIDEQTRPDWVGSVFAHEFVHSWCIGDPSAWRRPTSTRRSG
jgi:predicted metalloprotease with PDZ domain